jgi:imidazoleglycerol phosphate synthase cyclase subunit
MLKHRVIPCLLLHKGGLVKTMKFAKPKYVGDPVNAIRIFNDKEVDELMVLDIDATRESREPDYALIERFAGECFMPLCYGGGVRTVEQAGRLFALGVEKVSVQTAALADTALVARIADRFGSQSVVVSVDVKKSWLGKQRLYAAAGGRVLSRPWLEFLREAVAAGAGEVMLNAVDRDGTMQGMDLDLIREASDAIGVPLIAAGGAGSLRDIKAAVDAGASAVSAGAFFVFHGAHRAVLITYPRYQELEQLMSNPYQICTRCVMDTTAADIVFDEHGVCNFCTELIDRFGHVLNKPQSTRQQELEAFVAKVKSAGSGKRYDCVIGVSGGVDSSWALVQAVSLGLRPIAVHMDNGWNSELAQNNIANLVRGLGVDLYTHVIDWDEYRRLMQAFFDADVIDVELLYDNAMHAVNYQQAAKHGVKFILAGSNQATEGLRMPKGWNWFKYDKRNIKALGRSFGGVRINTFPAIGTLGFIWHELVCDRKWIAFLDYFDYKKFGALEVLQRDFGYKPYPYKHSESVFTRFYQGYILPNKFHADKRRPHFSNLIASGQMAREEALRDLQRIPYPSHEAEEQDKEYFAKKMGWSVEQVAEYIARPEKPHDAYPSEKPLWDLFFSARSRGYFYNFSKRNYQLIRAVYRRFT